MSILTLLCGIDLTLLHLDHLLESEQWTCILIVHQQVYLLLLLSLIGKVRHRTYAVILLLAMDYLLLLLLLLL